MEGEEIISRRSRAQALCLAPSLLRAHNIEVIGCKKDLTSFGTLCVSKV